VPLITMGVHPPDNVTYTAAGGDATFDLFSTYASGACGTDFATLDISVIFCNNTGAPYPATLVIDASGTVGNSAACTTEGSAGWGVIWPGTDALPILPYTNAASGTFFVPNTYHDHQEFALMIPVSTGIVGEPPCGSRLGLNLNVQSGSLHFTVTIRPLTPP
jgi:hypothetical protein